MHGDATLAVEAARRMLERGVLRRAFSSRWCRTGQARIRTQMSAAHTTADVERALEAFAATR